MVNVTIVASKKCPLQVTMAAERSRYYCCNRSILMGQNCPRRPRRVGQPKQRRGEIGKENLDRKQATPEDNVLMRHFQTSLPTLAPYWEKISFVYILPDRKEAVPPILAPEWAKISFVYISSPIPQSVSHTVRFASSSSCVLLAFSATFLCRFSHSPSFRLSHAQTNCPWVMEEAWDIICLSVRKNLDRPPTSTLCCKLLGNCTRSIPIFCWTFRRNITYSRLIKCCITLYGHERVEMLLPVPMLLLW